MSESARKPSSGDDHGIAIALAAFVLEAATMASVVFFRLALPVALAAHVLVVAALALRCRAVVRAGGDAGTPTLLAVAVAVAGPFGALGGALVDWLSVQGEEHRDRLQRWYERIALSTDTDDVTKLSDQVVVGRSMDLGSAAPASFARLIEHGSVTEKQAVLGLVARRFHPHYLSALKLALVSEEPVIRVQAAAVAARVRGSLGEEVERLLGALAAGPAAADALRLADEIDLCATSGLLEEQQCARAAEASRQARRQALDGLERAARPALAGTRVSGDGDIGVRAARRALEDRMLSSGRYDEFRRLRRAFAFPVKGRMRFRIGRWPVRRARRFAVVTGGAPRP